MGKEDPFDEVYKKEAPKLLETKDGDLQVITGKVGDVLQFQLEESKEEYSLSWNLIEVKLGFNKLYTLVEDKLYMDDEGLSGTRMIRLKLN